ncbi:TPA: SAM-dependent methyltransferase [Neisseria lactamica]
MTFQEYNNREKADRYAEYITGDSLRRYLAAKVEKYCGRHPSVFDGAAGSGQLEQYIEPSNFRAVEIQAEACAALRQNYPNAKVSNMSFFRYPNCTPRGCTVMNPPFSIKFKDLGKEEKVCVTHEFPWKKSGVMDEIFVLKGMENTRRFGFFILPPGIAYRKTEQRFREIIGNSLAELNRIQNAFEDTPIEVLLLVIDKEKTDGGCIRELYDCKTDTLLAADTWQIKPDLWQTVQKPAPPKEKEDPVLLEHECRDAAAKRIVQELRFSKMVNELEGWPHTEFDGFCDRLCNLIQTEKYGQKHYFPCSLPLFGGAAGRTSAKP